MKIQIISRIQYLPLVKQESFLRAKYEAEGLSLNEIATLTFSSRSTIVKYLERFGVTLRPDDRQLGVLPFGEKWRQRRIVLNAQEQATIEKAKRLREQGLSYEKIAAVMNAVAIKTKSGRAKWYAKTVRDIILRQSPMRP
jgi:transcriptional regulator with XRE-family HTH domain